MKYIALTAIGAATFAASFFVATEDANAVVVVRRPVAAPRAVVVRPVPRAAVVRPVPRRVIVR